MYHFFTNKILFSYNIPILDVALSLNSAFNLENFLDNSDLVYRSVLEFKINYIT